MADPNGAVKDRDEARVARIVRVEFNGQLTRIMDALGDPPDLNKLDMQFWTDEQQSIIRALRPEIERMVVAGAQTTFDLLPVQFDWALAAEDAIAFAQSYTFELVGAPGATGSSLTNTTRRILQKKVSAYIEVPTTIGELRNELFKAGFSKTRANAIAVTEVTRAYARGEEISAKHAQDAGLVLEPVWHTNRDEIVRKCPICWPNDGKRKSEGWTVPTVPGHVGCRCWLTHQWEGKGPNA